jgi:hypothetical protein
MQFCPLNADEGKSFVAAAFRSGRLWLVAQTLLSVLLGFLSAAQGEPASHAAFLLGLPQQESSIAGSHLGKVYNRTQ